MCLQEGNHREAGLDHGTEIMRSDLLDAIAIPLQRLHLILCSRHRITSRAARFSPLAARRPARRVC